MGGPRSRRDPPDAAERAAAEVRATETGGLTIAVDPRRVGRALGLIIALLCAADLAVEWLRIEGGHGTLSGLTDLLRLNGEANLPTWYSSAGLLACAALLFTIATAKRTLRDRFTTHWYVLAAGFAYISLDETAQIHDAIIGVRLNERFHLPGFAFFFVIPGAIITLVVFLSYLSFLRSMPGRSRALFLLSGAIFVGGAIVMESVGGALSSVFDWRAWPTTLAILLEEGMEMAGVGLFIYSLLDYAARELPVLSFVVRDPRQPPS